MTVITVGISKLKDNFGKYILGLKSGETIIIIRHGRAIARLIPIVDSIDSKLQSAVDAGLAGRNGGKVNPVTPAVVNRSNTQISDLVFGDRDFGGEP